MTQNGGLRTRPIYANEWFVVTSLLSRPWPNAAPSGTAGFYGALQHQ